MDAVDSQLDAVRQWLLARKPELSDMGPEIDPDLDLIENRIVDSLSFTEFVFFLEELVGRELQTTAETVQAFRTLRSIRQEILLGA